MHHAEDRGIGADAEGERQHREQREGRATGQLTGGIAEILQQHVHGPLFPINSTSQQIKRSRNDAICANAGASAVPEPVAVAVRVDQVRPAKQVLVAEDVGRRPVRATSPPSSTKQRSAMSSTIPRSWVAVTTDLAPPAQPTSRSMTWLWLRGSSAGGRLVEQQHLGIHHEHAGQRDALLLAARQALRHAVPEVRDAQSLERLVDALARPRLRSQPSCSGPNATSSKTVGLNSCTSGFWKTSPTRAAEGVGERVVGEARLGQRLARGTARRPRRGSRARRAGAAAWTCRSRWRRRARRACLRRSTASARRARRPAGSGSVTVRRVEAAFIVPPTTAAAANDREAPRARASRARRIAEVVEHVHLAAEAARLHAPGRLRRSGAGVLVEQHAGACAAPGAAVGPRPARPTVAAAARLEHVVRRSRAAAGCSGRSCRGRRRATTGHAEHAQRLEHVRPRRGEDQQERRAWRRLDTRSTQVAGRRQALRGDRPAEQRARATRRRPA